MNPNYSETYSLSAVGEHCPGSLRRGLVKTRSSLLLMQLSDKLLTLDLCICFDWFNMMRATAVASTLPNTKCFLLTKYYERYCSLCRPLVQMERISSRKVVLIMSFLSIVILSPTHCVGRVEVSHQISLSGSLCGEPTKTHPPGSEPALQKR